MKSKEFMRKVYRNFSDFVAVASAHELEFLVYDAKFTSAFNYRLKKIIDDIKEQGNPVAEFSVIFNTQGDIAIIDAEIVGRFIGDRFTVVMEDYYKEASLNKIIRSVVNGSDKVQEDFILIAYRILYNGIDETYMEIKSRKDILEQYKERYNILEYKESDISAVVGALLILEDICKYIGIKERRLMDLIDSCVYKKGSQK